MMATLQWIARFQYRKHRNLNQIGLSIQNGNARKVCQMTKHFLELFS